MDQLTYQEVDYLLHLLKQEARTSLGFSDIENAINGSASRKLSELKESLAKQFDK
jgi:hypothetical protein